MPVSGGGTFNHSAGPMLTEVTFSSNNAASGGGMYNYTSAPTLTNLTFSHNTADWGGGMYNNQNSSPVLTGITFSNNSANSGGAMYNYWDSSPTLMDITFSANTALYGGGIYDQGRSNPVLIGITFSGNTASEGGAMYNGAASLPLLTNVTFSGNSASWYGGGMFNRHNSNPTLTNVSFSGNTASSEGGGMYNIDNSNPTMRNSILWENNAPSSAQIYNSNSAPVINDSLVQGGCPAGSTCTNVITTDPLLGTLGDYDGDTQTIPLLPGSSAIDAGNGTYCTMGSDQRGVSYVGACDIGAFESQGFTLTKTDGDNQSTLVNTAFMDPLTLNITSAFDEPVDGGIVAFIPPASGASAAITGSPVTIADGAVSVTAAANGIPGGPYDVTASTTGASSVNFTLTNIPSPADDFVITVKTDNPGTSSDTQFSIPTYSGESITTMWIVTTMGRMKPQRKQGITPVPTLLRVPTPLGSKTTAAPAPASPGSISMMAAIKTNC